MNKLLSSIRDVVTQSKYVFIDRSAITTYVSNFQLTNVNHWMKACPFDYTPLSDQSAELMRWFLEDALAFCFWGYPQKWTVTYQDKTIDGWWALLACFQRALDSQIPLTDSLYLSRISASDARIIFAGEPEIPLIDARIRALRDIGQTLITHHKGQLSNYLAAAPTTAPELVIHLGQTFRIFLDTTLYHGREVLFYKKAQLFVHDLVTGFPESTHAKKITDMDVLTGEADYKIPSLLRDYGILIYNPELSTIIDQRSPIDSDSVMEVEIRANMLWACHLICEELKTKGITIDPTTLDGILWVKSQTRVLNTRPYHLTLTTDY